MYNNKWYSQKLIISISFNIDSYGKSRKFSVTLFNNWDKLFKFVKWLPKITSCDWRYWNLSWLCFIIHIDKHGQVK